MIECQEQQALRPKKKRTSRPVSGLFRRHCRKALREKVDANGSAKWIERVIGNLRIIASTDRTALGLQAIKIFIEQTEDEMREVEYVEESEHRLSRALLSRKTDEQLDSEIKGLDTEIKELQNLLGSVTTGTS